MKRNIKWVFCVAILLIATLGTHWSWCGDNTLELTEAAEQGDANAQYNLGLMYAKGQGVPKDDAEAVKWFRKAAEQGNAKGQAALASVYAFGQGVPKDYVRAVKWCRKAADQGLAGAQAALGGMYGEGLGVPKNYAETVKWFRKAADQGDAVAQSGLGLMYAKGLGVPQNYVKAYKWSSLSAAQGNADAAKVMDLLSPRMTPDQIAQALQQAEPTQSAENAAPQAAPEAPPQATPAPTIDLSVNHPNYHEPERSQDFALVIGIAKYASLPPANYADKDAAAMRRHLIALGFPPRHIKFLENSEATKSRIAAYLNDWLPRNVKPGSTVFFYYSGHGSPDVKNGTAYLVPEDGDPDYLNETGYPLGEVYRKLNALSARRVIVALDSCFSGAGGRSVIASGARPLVTHVRFGLGAGGKVVTLTASKGDQISGVYQDHGLFTYYLLKGLNGAAKNHGGRVTIESLYRYLKPKVEDAANLDNRGQDPQLFPRRLPPGADMALREK